MGAGVTDPKVEVYSDEIVEGATDEDNVGAGVGVTWRSGSGVIGTPSREPGGTVRALSPSPSSFTPSKWIGGLVSGVGERRNANSTATVLDRETEGRAGSASTGTGVGEGDREGDEGLKFSY